MKGPTGELLGTKLFSVSDGDFVERARQRTVVVVSEMTNLSPNIVLIVSAYAAAIVEEGAGEGRWLSTVRAKAAQVQGLLPIH